MPLSNHAGSKRFVRRDVNHEQAVYLVNYLDLLHRCVYTPLILEGTCDSCGGNITFNSTQSDELVSQPETEGYSLVVYLVYGNMNKFDGYLVWWANAEVYYYSRYYNLLKASVNWYIGPL